MAKLTFDVRHGSIDHHEHRVPGAGVPFRDRPLAEGRIIEGPEMVVVPRGSFLMGPATDEIDSSGRPQHLVTIAEPFAIGRCPITRGQFAAFVEATRREPRDIDCSWRNLYFPQDDTHPVVSVSWFNAVAYATWLEQASGKPYRLPSEAEWEYCCRATTTTVYNTGNRITREDAHFDESEKDGTVPVASFAPNAWGLFDMHGNVNEWCADNWHRHFDDSAPVDGTVWQGGDAACRTIRGGGCYCLAADLRSAYRGAMEAEERGLVGFRVARPL